LYCIEGVVIAAQCTAKTSCLYLTPNVVRVIRSRKLRWAGLDPEWRSAFRILTGKRPFGRPRRRWEDNIRYGPKEIGINTKNWVDSAQYRAKLESCCKCEIEPPGSISHGIT
jgi:hypothetical protein